MHIVQISAASKTSRYAFWRGQRSAESSCYLDRGDDQSLSPPLSCHPAQVDSLTLIPLGLKNLLTFLILRSQKLLTHLADVYVQTGGDVKRTILRILEAPIKEIGMESEELLSLVENCPKGSETLVTRIIHILTERTAPSPELVNKVRDLYAKRVADVRFLIPVLNGLTKQEVGAALPKLIKLNPVVVKEVFNRLLGTGSSAQSGAMTPADLMIALHNIDTSKCDMKTIIKATGLSTLGFVECLFQLFVGERACFYI